MAAVDALVPRHALSVKQRIRQAGRQESREGCIANICAKNPCIVDTIVFYLVCKVTNARRYVMKLADNDALTEIAQPLVQRPVNCARKFAHGNLLICDIYVKYSLRYTRVCPHYVCPVPCGLVGPFFIIVSILFISWQACTRLPCDKKCEKRLRCGHRCPSSKSNQLRTASLS